MCSIYGGRVSDEVFTFIAGKGDKFCITYFLHAKHLFTQRTYIFLAEISIAACVDSRKKIQFSQNKCTQSIHNILSPELALQSGRCRLPLLGE
jgi:hypothetical protein